MSSEKEKCDCGKLATWVYMPGYSADSNDYHCDDCVPRGCSCNWEGIKDYDGEPNLPIGIENKDWKWITPEDWKEAGLDGPIVEKHYWIELEDGKAYPCCEFNHSKDGWDKDIEPIEQLYAKRIKDENGNDIVY